MSPTRQSTERGVRGGKGIYVLSVLIRVKHSLLDVETASQVEREFALRHAEGIKGYEVKISSDERNYLIRFSKELSDTLLSKKTAKILPINADEFIIKVV